MEDVFTAFLGVNSYHTPWGQALTKTHGVLNPFNTLTIPRQRHGHLIITRAAITEVGLFITTNSDFQLGNGQERRRKNRYKMTLVIRDAGKLLHHVIVEFLVAAHDGFLTIVGYLPSRPY